MRALAAILLALTAWSATQDTPPANGDALAANFTAEVDRRLDVPREKQQEWAQLLDQQFQGKNLTPQYILLVDRSPVIQAIAIYWLAPDHSFHYIGASPVSTGKPGAFNHFITPTGVFEHTVTHLDFRAEGTRNENGIRGYGAEGMRAYDFGWQKAVRGWGRGGESRMRLLMHATDPVRLESRLGTRQSDGCVRIPATLNTFIDHHSILDADYEKAMKAGKTFAVLPKDRAPTPWSGRYLVVVDTGGTTRRAWSADAKLPAPSTRHANK